MTWNRWRHVVAVAGVMALAAAVPGSVIPITAATPAAAPTFGNPTISGVQGTGFEQDLRIDRSGRRSIGAGANRASGAPQFINEFDADSELCRAALPVLVLNSRRCVHLRKEGSRLSGQASSVALA